MIKRIYNRPGSRGHRNAENSPLDRNDEGAVNASGSAIRKPKSTAKTPKRFESRGRLDSAGVKRPKSQDETRDSSREPSRGRSEFTGRMNKRVNQAGSKLVRTGTTASKAD